jgi:hypothetical protein
MSMQNGIVYNNNMMNQHSQSLNNGPNRSGSSGSNTPGVLNGLPTNNGFDWSNANVFASSSASNIRVFYLHTQIKNSNKILTNKILFLNFENNKNLNRFPNYTSFNKFSSFVRFIVFF